MKMKMIRSRSLEMMEGCRTGSYGRARDELVRSGGLGHGPSKSSAR